MVIDWTALKKLPGAKVKGYRLINSKYPPISLFDDVADADEFEALFELQALTNPRILNEVGQLRLIPLDAIPFKIVGCAYAVAPFTHINPDGSRFSDGSYGVMYIADDYPTAVEEVRYHLNLRFKNIPELAYDRIVMRGLVVRFDEAGLHDLLPLERSSPIYDPEDYTAPRALAKTLRDKAQSSGVRYHSVRRAGGRCWGLFTPKNILSVRQGTHYEMVWNGEVTAVNKLTTAER